MTEEVTRAFLYGLVYGVVCGSFAAWLVFVFLWHSRRNKFVRFQSWLYNRLYSYLFTVEQSRGIIRQASADAVSGGQVKWLRLLEQFSEGEGVDMGRLPRR